MDDLLNAFQSAHSELAGPLLATTLSPIAPPHYLNRLDAISAFTNSANCERDIGYALTKSYTRPIKYPSPEVNTWTDIYAAYWRAVVALNSAQEADEGRGQSKGGWVAVYDAWKDLANTVIRGYTSQVLEAWTLPVLYIVGKFLRLFAIRADSELRTKKHDSGVDVSMSGVGDDIAGIDNSWEKNVKLEDAARVINRMFTLCISDRQALETSLKFGIYYTSTLLFKTYFKLNSISLCKNILRALNASSGDLPPLEAFPKSHVVTFKYYLGVLQFLEEDYSNALESLTSALHLLPPISSQGSSFTRQRTLLLTYLIPAHLLSPSHTLPSSRLLTLLPLNLSSLFRPLISAIRQGNLFAFDAALADGSLFFVKRRIYLSLERGRDICLRNLLRKVYLAAGYDDQGRRQTRIKLDEFIAAVRFSSSPAGLAVDANGELMERDEVECLIANTIYKGLMKGYIARQAAIVVLSKSTNSAFPGTGV